MILFDGTHVAPLQLNIYEQGPLGGLPTIAGAGHAFTSQWFDVWRMHIEDIIVPQTGAIVPADSTTNLAAPDAPLLRNAGLYFLDVFAFHLNATNDPFTLQVFGSESGSLEVAPTAGVTLFTDVVPTGAPAFQKRYVINPRLFYFRWIYSVVSAATDFKMTAVLRST